MKFPLLSLACFCLLLATRAAAGPNVVMIYVDDMGYGDLGVQGAKGFATPHLDRMAAGGMRFTDFYVAAPVCSASRAALLTGCYPPRVGIHGALGPKSKTGLNPDEMTLAEMLKAKGYATALFGKWHLGDHPDLLPLKQGFDEYLGLPYSNDMWPENPNAKAGSYPPLPLLEGAQAAVPQVTAEVQASLTTRYAERAVQFIRQHQASPFFLYVAPSMPHVPLFVSTKFKGKSAQGLYGDVIEEIDWAVGEILGALKQGGLDGNTLVIFASDNGPWSIYGNHAGSPGPFRESKGTCWEGGIRVPCLMRWPGQIPAGSVCRKMAGAIDILPTVAALTGAPLPDKKIDGLDISPLLRGVAGAESPHESLLFYYEKDELQALRSGPWKLMLPHTYRTIGRPGADGLTGRHGKAAIGLELYNLEQDPGETRNQTSAEPAVLARLSALAQAAREELGDALTQSRGRGQRPPALVDWP
jgi:arylsulfatase A-like enzyme